ncbi:putative transmembrane permease MsmF [Enterococcus casseliflavus 14-MB-W-14]|uniref:carbohydrate ABC transporter permease n=1 Tax=Enterococcus casseliflavus TaxID=37734 RepID=UPI0003546D39|nr:sugar ABC transporter permease [Enterococcus casseliflavus]EPH63844.1 putative transmembrane permease MsmF [Enterococcus casseliflavus 14-MB-W-14]
MNGKHKRNRMGLLYIMPWLIGLVIFVIYPFISSLILSFTNYNLISKPTFVGFDNFIKLFTDDPDFLQSIFATFRYAFFTVPFQLIFALFIAFILNFKLKGINFFRTAYYIPSILGGNVAIAVLWRFLFSGDGLINQLLKTIGLDPVGWLSEPGPAMAVISLLRIWQFGSSMVIFLAALKEIPVELYEAAEVDGAGKWRIFFKITIPLITPTIFFNLVMQLVNAFQEFNAPFLITSGGPLKSTYLTSLMIYDNAFRFFQMGYASAMSWVLFIIIMIFTLVLFKTSNRWVYYSDEGGK